MSEEIHQLRHEVKELTGTLSKTEESLSHAVMLELVNQDLYQWAMSHGASHKDATALSNSMKEFLNNSSQALKNASQVMEVLGRVLKAIDKELDDSIVGDEKSDGDSEEE